MADTVERWAEEYLASTELAHKLAPPPAPRRWEDGPAPLRVAKPGRPTELTVVTRAKKTPGPEAMRAREKRAQVVHTFLHHELQAAELMCWALLAFPEAPRAFRQGLVGIMADEVRHMAMYGAHLEKLGHRFGDFPVRDWFWERVPEARSAADYAATMGVGLEGANLDHCARFAGLFRAVGDDEGAALEERVGAEEIPHVRFALHWLPRLSSSGEHVEVGGPIAFARWAAHLPPPLSPLLMKGAPLDLEARREAGFSEAFLGALESYRPSVIA